MRISNEVNIEKIYNIHLDDMYSYALHLGFEEEYIMDAIHDVFFNLCKKENEIEKIENLGFYLLRSLKNRLLNIYRSKDKITELNPDIDIDDLPFDVKVSIEEEFITQEEHLQIRAQIEQMLEVLTPRQREIIYLRYQHEYSYEQISDLMNITIPASRKLVHKAMTTLRQHFPKTYFLVLFL